MPKLTLATLDDKQHAFLLAEYDRLGEQLASSESEGERRLTVLLTATGGVAALLGYLLKEFPQYRLPSQAGFTVVIGALALLYGLCQLTARRLVKRDATTDRITRERAEIQRVYVGSPKEAGFEAAFAGVQSYVEWVNARKPDANPRLQRDRGLGNGGWLVSTLAFMSVLAGGAVAMLLAALGARFYPDHWDQRTGLPNDLDALIFVATGLAVVFRSWRHHHDWALERSKVALGGVRTVDPVPNAPAPDGPSAAPARPEA